MEQWTALFNPRSTYDGRWNKGSKMLFIGTDKKFKQTLSPKSKTKK